VRAVVCLAGGIASGKITAAQALAEVRSNSSVLSFGDVVRRRAQAGGLPLDRAALQETGLRLIAEGWPAFIDEPLVDVPSDAHVLLIDGVRHVEPIEELRRRFSNALICVVYLTTDQTTLRRRIAERNEPCDACRHHIESSLKAVAAIADLKIETCLSPEAIAAIIFASTQDFRIWRYLLVHHTGIPCATHPTAGLKRSVRPRVGDLVATVDDPPVREQQHGQLVDIVDGGHTVVAQHVERWPRDEVYDPSGTNPCTCTTSRTKRIRRNRPSTFFQPGKSRVWIARPLRSLCVCNQVSGSRCGWSSTLGRVSVATGAVLAVRRVWLGVERVAAVARR
jgi:AAA domain